MSELIISERVIQLLEIALEKTTFSLAELADEMDVSTRSVRNYVKQLNTDLDQIASIKNKKNEGYYLEIHHPNQLDTILKQNKQNVRIDTPKHRLAFIMDRLMNDDKIYTLDELAYELHMGRTTLVNELKKSSVSLKTYHLQIQGKQNKGMYLSGDELNLRFFIIDHLYDLLYDSYPLDQDIIDEIKKVCVEHDVEASTQTRIMQFVTIMLDRLLRKHLLHELDNKYKELLGSPDFHIATQITDAIERQLPVSIPELETLFITIPIAGRRTPTNTRTMADIAITDDIKNLLEKIMEEVGFNKEIINENESFFTDLQYHLTFMINRLMFGLRIKNPLLDEVKIKYPLAFKMAQIAGQVIDEEYDFETPEDELGFLAFYFGVFISNTNVKVKQFRKAAIICGTGRGTAKLLAMQLERVLNQNTEIDLYSDQEVNVQLLKSYDLVFSTVDLNYELESPIIKISEILDEEKVKQEIDKISYMGIIPQKHQDAHHSILKNLITRDRYFSLTHTKSYKDNVKDMVVKLTNLGYLDEGFYERLQEREKKGSMAFSNYIALPHNFQYQSNSIELALGVFDEPIQENGKEIKFIFLLGLPKQQSDNVEHMIVKIYDEILRIANHKNLLDLLLESKGYEDVMDALEYGSKL